MPLSIPSIDCIKRQTTDVNQVFNIIKSGQGTAYNVDTFVKYFNALLYRYYFN